jgi:preprotein translocase subunit SecY
MQFILLFHGINDYAKASQCNFIRTSDCLAKNNRHISNGILLLILVNICSSYSKQLNQNSCLKIASSYCRNLHKPFLFITVLFQIYTSPFFSNFNVEMLVIASIERCKSVIHSEVWV